MPGVGDHALHESVAFPCCIDTSPQDPCLLDGNLSITRRVESQERHAEIARRLVALYESAQHIVVGPETNDSSIELVARDVAERSEPVGGVGIRDEPRAH